MTSPMKGKLVHLKWHFHLLSVRYSFLHIWSTLHGVLSWSVPSSYSTIKMSSAMPNTFGSSLNISFILFWNMSPYRAVPNSSLLYLFLPNWHANVVKSKDFCPALSCGIMSLHLSVRSCTVNSFQEYVIDSRASVYWSYYAWLNLPGSKHSHTSPFGLGTSKKLLQCSDILSTPKSMIICCFVDVLVLL